MMNNGVSSNNTNTTNNNNNADIDELKNAVHRLNEMFGQEDRWASVVEDMHTFATELDNLKNTIIKLQTYTMDVNKMLLETSSINKSAITDHMDGIIVEDNTM